MREPTSPSCPRCGGAVRPPEAGLFGGPGTPATCARCGEAIPTHAQADAGATASEVPDPAGVRTDGLYLLVDDGAEGPPRCVKCNAPTVRYYKKRLSWHNPWLFLVLLAGLLPYVVVALGTQRYARVSLGLCDAHAARRRWRVVGAWLAFASSFGLWLLASAVRGSRDHAPFATLLVLAGILAFLGGLVGAMFALRVVTPKRIEDGVATLKGAGPAFLASLRR